MKRMICLSVLTLMATTAALADIARPDPTKTPKVKPSRSIEMNMSIHLKEDATEAKLLIPKSALKQLRAAIDEMDDNDNATAEVTTNSFSRTQTVLSGMFLSLALVFGGMWFVRSGKAATKAGKMLVILAVVTGVGSAATFIYANAGPPSEARSITGKMFSQAVHYYNYGSGKIRLETKDDLGGVDLIVPNPPDRPKTDE